MSKPVPRHRNDYAHFLRIPTRWMDNDVYGHVNNVNYYSFFDTVVNQYLVQKGVIDFARSKTIGLVVDTQCHYLQPVAFPDVIDAGLRVAALGSSSVRYEIGLFREGDDKPAAQGHFVHVYVCRESRRPEPLSDELRHLLVPLLATDSKGG